jgi:hypothetical protein
VPMYPRWPVTRMRKVSPRLDWAAVVVVVSLGYTRSFRVS